MSCEVQSEKLYHLMDILYGSKLSNWWLCRVLQTDEGLFVMWNMGCKISDFVRSCEATPCTFKNLSTISLHQELTQSPFSSIDIHTCHFSFTIKSFPMLYFCYHYLLLIVKTCFIILFISLEASFSVLKCLFYYVDLSWLSLFSHWDFHY